METSESLSIESFSYSWPVNPEDSFRSSDEASFIEMDPTLPPSQRFFSINLPDFSTFNFPVTNSPLPELLHGDELISDGFLAARPIKSDSFDRAALSDSLPLDLTHRRDQGRSSGGVRCAPLKRCGRLSWRILRKYLDVIRPICQRLRRRSGVISPTVSNGVAYSVANWRRSCDSECSIHDAVLHCKRTIVGDK